ncbi:MAG: cob(I)yrinic acid a,c-diamide adenosyltransferase [Pseudomonadota bacterium]|nr:cob(I)yrinic acid a,c-diamide adenosyltransferase [Pseudomonadota bacterium]
MGYRITRVYTRTGDDGKTGLGDGSRVEKTGLRVAAIGDVDELNSQLGVVLSFGCDALLRDCLVTIQHDLFRVGGELSMPGAVSVIDADVKRIEADIDRFNGKLPALEEFILPGGGPAAAACHCARAVCRRAERSLLALSTTEQVNAALLHYMNRMSDLLFVLARTLAREAREGEVFWDRNRNGQS